MVSSLPVISCRSPFLQEPIDQPAASNVLPAGAAVFDHIGTITPGLFKRIRQDRQIGEAALLIDPLCPLYHGAPVPPPPGRLDARGAEWVAEDLAEQVALGLGLGGHGPLARPFGRTLSGVDR